MKRLRQAEVLSKVDTVDKGLNAMRSALWRRQRRRHRAWMQTRIKPHSQERPEAGPRSHRPCRRPVLAATARVGAPARTARATTVWTGAELN